jgi:micrococcal nuclease
MHRLHLRHRSSIQTYRTSIALIPLLGIVLLLLLACRSGPPPPTASDQLASRRQEATGQYQDVVVIDAQCSSFASKDDQVVCIANKGKDPVKMGKWLVRNTIGRTYYFPDSTVLDPGKSIHLHTGAGANSATDLYWNYEFKPVFDLKDQISLVDASNVVVANFTTP